MAREPPGLSPRPAPRARALQAARALLFLLGGIFVVYLVRDAGPARVAAVLRAAGPYLPAVIGLELGFLLCDSAALALLLGVPARAVPFAAWRRSASLAYALMVLVPAGRAAGEVARAAVLGPHVGRARTAVAVAHMNAAYMCAIGLASLAASVAASRAGGLLWALCLGNAVVVFGASAGLLLLSRSARLRAWLGRRWPRFRDQPGAAPGAGARPRRVLLAAFVSAFARAMQAVQYGLVIAAVGGVASAPHALVTQGAHLVGATVGDLVPNQVGVNEGAYRAFADQIGFAGAPERALSIAFVVRIAQLALALLCLAIAAISPASPPLTPATEPAPEPDSEEDRRAET